MEWPYSRPCRHSRQMKYCWPVSLMVTGVLLRMSLGVNCPFHGAVIAQRIQVLSRAREQHVGLRIRRGFPQWGKSKVRRCLRPFDGAVQSFYRLHCSKVAIEPKSKILVSFITKWKNPLHQWHIEIMLKMEMSCKSHHFIISANWFDSSLKLKHHNVQRLNRLCTTKVQYNTLRLEKS